MSEFSAPSFRSFLGAFRHHWFTAMSGGLSVPFTFGAVVADAKWGKIGWAALAIICGVYASFSVWKDERSKRNESDAKIAAYFDSRARITVSEPVRRDSSLASSYGAWRWLLPVTNTHVHAPADQVELWLTEIAPKPTNWRGDPIYPIKVDVHPNDSFVVPPLGVGVIRNFLLFDFYWGANPKLYPRPAAATLRITRLNTDTNNPNRDFDSVVGESWTLTYRLACSNGDSKVIVVQANCEEDDIKLELKSIT